MMNFTDVETKMVEVVKDYIYDIMTMPYEWVGIQTDTILQNISEEVLGEDYEALVFSPKYDEIEKKVCMPLLVALNCCSAVYAE